MPLHYRPLSSDLLLLSNSPFTSSFSLSANQTPVKSPKPTTHSKVAGLMLHTHIKVRIPFEVALEGMSTAEPVSKPSWLRGERIATRDHSRK